MKPWSDPRSPRHAENLGGDGFNERPQPAGGPVRVGYALKMFPRLSETFILNEVLELERQGLSLKIFSIKRPADAVVHAQSGKVRAPISYLPENFYGAPLRVAR